MSSPLSGPSTPRRVNAFIFGHQRYQVTAPVVVASQLSGGEVYVYQNGLLPSNSDPTHIEHLLREGLIRAIETSAP